MIKAWRLCQAAHATAAFDGEGARIYGGRWNHKGQPIVYTAGSLSLAALEVLIHADTDLVPNDFVVFEITMPDTEMAVERLDANLLPIGWQAQFPPLACQQAGSNWLAQGNSAVLSVPSAVIPGEWNYLLNPKHKDFKRCRISEPRTFRFDPRLWA